MRTSGIVFVLQQHDANELRHLKFPTTNDLLIVHETEVVAIAFGHLYILYLMLAFGFCLSFFVLIIELLNARATQKKDKFKEKMCWAFNSRRMNEIDYYKR